MSSKVAKKKRVRAILEAFLNVIHLIHAASGIDVSVDIHNGIFSYKTVFMLVLSCACSLIYATLLSYLLIDKFNLLEFPWSKKILFGLIGAQISCKLAAFGIVFYIIATTWGAADLLAGFVTPLGLAGSFMNMLGNQVYTFFISVTMVGYAKFILTYLLNKTELIRGSKAGARSATSATGNPAEHRTSTAMSAKSEPNDDPIDKLSASHIRWTKGFVVMIALVCLSAITISILSLVNVLQHAVGVAINAYASAIISFCNIWTDDQGTKMAKKIEKSSRASTASQQARAPSTASPQKH